MINKDFFAALADLEREKGISEETFIEALSTALASAYKKQYIGEGGDVEVRLNPEKGTIRFFLKRTVSDAEELADNEISLEDAQEIKKSAKPGDVLTEEFTPKDFTRIAAQTAKQVILQKIHETERDNTLSEFSDKEGELMSGLVRKVDARNVYIELGKGQIEGLMLPQDQVPGERYPVGEHLKVYVKRVKSGGKNAQVLVSRAAPGLVKRLFEEEVPEIKAGTVVVKGQGHLPRTGAPHQDGDRLRGRARRRRGRLRRQQGRARQRGRHRARRREDRYHPLEREPARVHRKGALARHRALRHADGRKIRRRRRAR